MAQALPNPGIPLVGLQCEPPTHQQEPEMEKPLEFFVGGQPLHTVKVKTWRYQAVQLEDGAVFMFQFLAPLAEELNRMPTRPPDMLPLLLSIQDMESLRNDLDRALQMLHAPNSKLPPT